MPYIEIALIENRNMKKIIVLLVVLFVLGAGWYGWNSWQQSRQPANENELTLYGNVDIREAQLAFNGSEHIGKMLVEEGDHVKAGQLLASLHTDLLTASVEQIDAQINAQKQEVAKLKSGSRPEEIKRALAQLKAAQAKARSAQDTYRRSAQLLKKKLISPEATENTHSIAMAAADEVEASRQTLNLLKKGPRQEDIAAAEAQLLALKANLKLARQHLKDANLYAPADGIIRNRILQPGEMAFPQTPVLSLALTNPVWVRTYVPETSLGKVSLGAKAVIHTDSYPDKQYNGWVGFISPTAEFTPKNVQTPELRTRLVYSMRVFACNPQDELRLGMPATVTIELGQKPDETSSSSNRCQ
jgi:HlyD family secretion protein